MEPFTLRPRSAWWRWWTGLVGAALALAGIASLVRISDRTFGAVAGGVLLVALGAGQLCYLWRVRCDFDKSGVTIRNPMSTYVIPWSQVAEVEIDEVILGNRAFTHHRLVFVTPARHIAASGTTVSPRRSADQRRRVLAYRDEVLAYGYGTDASVVATGASPAAESLWRPVWRRVPKQLQGRITVILVLAVIVLGLLPRIVDVVR